MVWWSSCDEQGWNLENWTTFETNWNYPWDSKRILIKQVIPERSEIFARVRNLAWTKLHLIWSLRTLDTINEEFDPGSGRTLAARLTHASRTETSLACFRCLSGGRVSNTWATCLSEGDNVRKRTLIPHNVYGRHRLYTKGAIRWKMGSRPIS